MTKQELLNSIKDGVQFKFTGSKAHIERIATLEQVRKYLLEKFQELEKDALSPEIRELIQLVCTQTKSQVRIPTMIEDVPFPDEFVDFAANGFSVLGYYKNIIIPINEAEEPKLFKKITTQNYSSAVAVQEIAQVLKKYECIYLAVKNALPKLYDELDAFANRNMYRAQALASETQFKCLETPEASKGEPINIRHLCYDLYKVEWESKITAAKRKANVVEYYEALENGSFDGTFEDWIFKNGYCGEFCPNFNEFLRGNFLDEHYMELLLSDFNPQYTEAYEEALAQEHNCDLDQRDAEREDW